jgi:DNA repair exonuclease SbcCD ATPase subunit
MESDSDELADLQDYNDEGSVDLEDEESDMDVDIEDEEFTDDEDMEDEDLYGTEDDVGFHVDYDTDEEDEESEEDYNPDADVEDLEDDESEEDMEGEEESEDEEEDSEEDEENEEYYYDDEEEDFEEDEEDSEDEEDEEDEELEENEKKTSEEKAVKVVEDLIKQIENALNVLDTDKHPGLEQRLKRMLKTAQGKKEELQEAIKLDWKRSGQRSPFTGMFKEEAEHDYMLEQVQAQIQALQQEVEELQESNKKLRSGLKESINLVENLTDKVKKYEQKLHESRLLNYKLLYTNKALSDSSLNGQQKNKIAESIDGAKTAEEVKLLYETLKSTMRDGTSRSTPKSLSEAVERRSSSLLLRGSRAEPKKQDDFAERMKRLAGL